MKPFYQVTIDLTEAKTHRALVSIEKKTENLPGTLDFPVWTPGSYLVREYSRHITRLEPATKITKNRWQVAEGAKAISYEVYCFERTVRTSFLDENYAVLVGATLLPLLHGPFELELLLPKDWKLVSSALKFHAKGQGRFTTLVSDDDKWIDSPLIAAAPGYGGVGHFSLQGIPHHIAWVGLEMNRPMKDLENAFKKIAASTLKLFGGAPFKEYWFLLHFGHKLYGGLEHRDSQLSQFDGALLSRGKEWDAFLRLIAHEYFHSWNVKSLRPKALGPFDYSKENYTQDIWFAEGLTDYFDDLLCWKAGLISKEAYGKARLKDASLLADGIPAHFRRSLAETSMDAWIRYYRSDEDSINTDVSYYSKGALLGWCWDSYLQKKSKGRWDLSKLMKAIWKEFGIDAYEALSQAKPGYSREELYKFCEKKTKIPHASVLEAWISKRKPLPWREAARWHKLNPREQVADQALHFLGLQLQWKGSSATVGKVIAGSEAEAAAIAPQDEILAMNGTRITDAEKFQLTLEQAMREGKKIDLIVARLDKVFPKSIFWKKHPGVGVEYLL